MSSFAPKLEGRVLRFWLILGKSFWRNKKAAKKISYSIFNLVEMIFREFNFRSQLWAAGKVSLVYLNWFIDKISLILLVRFLVFSISIGGRVYRLEGRVSIVKDIYLPKKNLTFFQTAELSPFSCPTEKFDISKERSWSEFLYDEKTCWKLYH